MTAMHMQSCAVLGAGLLGLCTALRLQQRGCVVSLIDRDEPGRGASYGNAGFLAAESIDPLSTWATLKSAPGLLYDKYGPLAVPAANALAAAPWLLKFVAAAWPAQVSKNRVALASLNRLAVAAWKDALQAIGRPDLLVKSGYLLAWERPSGLLAARTERQHLDHWGINADLIDGRTLGELEPAFEGAFNHALYFPDAWRVLDPKWLCDTLFNAFVEGGGQFLRRRVDSIDVSGSYPHLSMGGATVKFAKLVLCAGVHSAALLKPLGIHVPLMAERGYHLHCLNANITNTPLCSVERKVFLSPLNSGLRVVGISELGGVTLPSQPVRFSTLGHHAKALLPTHAQAIEAASEWMGMRPTLPDSLPVIDTLPNHTHTAMAFGNQHLGLTQAAISAQLVVDKLFGASEAINLEPFRVDRFR